MITFHSVSPISTISMIWNMTCSAQIIAVFGFVEFSKSENWNQVGADFFLKSQRQHNCNSYLYVKFYMHMQFYAFHTGIPFACVSKIKCSSMLLHLVLVSEVLKALRYLVVWFHIIYIWDFCT